MLERIHAVSRALIISMVALLCAAPGATPAADSANPGLQARVARILKSTPLIDGHNDLPWEIRIRFKSDLAAVDQERCGLAGVQAAPVVARNFGGASGDRPQQRLAVALQA